MNDTTSKAFFSQIAHLKNMFSGLCSLIEWKMNYILFAKSDQQRLQLKDVISGSNCFTMLSLSLNVAWVVKNLLINSDFTFVKNSNFFLISDYGFGYFFSTLPTQP